MKLKSHLLLTATLLVGCLIGQAQQLGKGTVINPWPPTPLQTFIQAVTITYEYQKITLTDYNAQVSVSFGGKSYQVYADVYADPEIAWDLGQQFEDDLWGNCLVVDFSDEVYEAAAPLGEYTINIPQGFVENENGETNEAQTITFIRVDEVAPVTVTPPDGMYKPSELSNVQVKFNGTLTEIEGSGDIEIRKKNDWLSDPIVLENYTVEGSAISLNLENILPKGYEYMVNIPAAFVMVGDNALNKEVWLNYTSWDGLPQATVISGPNSVSTLQTLKPLVLTWNYQNIHFTPDAPDTEFVVGHPDYGIQDGWRTMIPADYYELVNVDMNGNITMDPAPSEVNAIYLDLEEFTEEYPNYEFEITIPVGLVENNEGLQNPALIYNFMIRESWSDPSITTSTDMIYIEWPDCGWITIGDLDVPPTLTYEDGTVYELEFTYGHALEGQISLDNDVTHGMEIDLSDMNLRNGTYTLFIPQGYVILDEQGSEAFNINEELKYTFDYNNGTITTGVKQIQIDNLPQGIFDLQGRKVDSGNNPVSLKKGIYIVNGKKILIK